LPRHLPQGSTGSDGGHHVSAPVSGVFFAIVPPFRLTFPRSYRPGGRDTWLTGR
jgi:hypothetical protein